MVLGQNYLQPADIGHL